MKEFEILKRNLKDSAAHSKLKLLKKGEKPGVEKPGGEKRIHIGSMSDEKKWDQFFFPNGGSTFEVVVSKIDLIKYMSDAKDEFLNPKQSYRLNISDFYEKLSQQTLEIKQDSFKICFEKNTDERRYYLTRPGQNDLSKNYEHIISICLPIVTQYVFLRIKDGNSYIFYLIPEFKPDNISLDSNTSDFHKDNSECDNNLQQIFYGAPGTGKSFAIGSATEGQDVIRTTFHPDSDYSTFVGSYKPTTIDVPMRDVTGKVIVENGRPVTDKRIIYEFVNQAFMQAYIGAWQKMAEDTTGNPKKQFLVIEEINRGNCAQIFGDLFQLLDRNPHGFSEYPIKADADMKKQLKKQLAGLSIENAAVINAMYKNEDMVSKVLDGDILLLPSNLFIWATMNTSDQSLFPIDSAFKRRWDWKYVPIANAAKNWAIEANSKKYDWWDFLKKINALIGETTNSEDKKLGYFFCKTETGIIDAETFVGKVIFYLWNDVFKDFEFEGDVFVDSDGETKLTFDKFYNQDATVQESTVEVFLNNLGVIFADEVADEEITPEEDDEFIPEESDMQQSANSGSRRFTVTFPDGTIIEENTHFDTYVKALEKIGLDKAESVASSKRYTRKKCALVDQLQRDEIINSNFSYVMVAGYYIVKGIIVDTMRDLLNQISNELALGLNIEIRRV